MKEIEMMLANRYIVRVNICRNYLDSMGSHRDDYQ